MTIGRPLSGGGSMIGSAAPNEVDGEVTVVQTIRRREQRKTARCIVRARQTLLTLLSTLRPALLHRERQALSALWSHPAALLTLGRSRCWSSGDGCLSANTLAGDRDAPRGRLIEGCDCPVEPRLLLLQFFQNTICVQDLLL